jgi:hypothetical protein
MMFLYKSGEEITRRDKSEEAEDEEDEGQR